jgi:hypothetical protein
VGFRVVAPAGHPLVTVLYGVLQCVVVDLYLAGILGLQDVLSNENADPQRGREQKKTCFVICIRLFP